MYENEGVTMNGLEDKYFILTPTKDSPYGHASRIAIQEYARFIQDHNTALYNDLLNWLTDIDSKLSEKELFNMRCKKCERIPQNFEFCGDKHCIQK